MKMLARYETLRVIGHSGETVTREVPWENYYFGETTNISCIPMDLSRIRDKEPANKMIQNNLLSILDKITETFPDITGTFERKDFHKKIFYMNGIPFNRITQDEIKIITQCYMAVKHPTSIFWMEGAVERGVNCKLFRFEEVTLPATRPALKPLSLEEAKRLILTIASIKDRHLFIGDGSDSINKSIKIVPGVLSKEQEEILRQSYYSVIE